MFVPSSYNALDELAYLYKSYAQKIEVTVQSRSRSRSQNTPKRIIRKTSRSQFHYNALEELGQLYDVSFQPIRERSESPPSALRKRPLSVIQELQHDTSESLGNIGSIHDSSDEEIPPSEWSYDYPNYDDSSFQEDSAFESGDVTSDMLNAPVLSPPKQRPDRNDKPRDTLSPSKMFLDGTMNKKSNYFELQMAAESSLTEGEQVKVPEFDKISSPDMAKLPDLPVDLPSKHIMLNRAFSSDHFEPTDLECFLEHLVSRGRIGGLTEIRTKYSHYSKSELQNLPPEELSEVKEAIEAFDPYTRKERTLMERCLKELGL